MVSVDSYFGDYTVDVCYDGCMIISNHIQLGNYVVDVCGDCCKVVFRAVGVE